MTRREDPALASRRRSVLGSLGNAHLFVDTMRDKCGEMLSATSSELTGNRYGDEMAARLRQSMEVLERARIRLHEAIDAAHDIETTVEVDDERQEDRW